MYNKFLPRRNRYQEIFIKKYEKRDFSMVRNETHTKIIRPTDHMMAVS